MGNNITYMVTGIQNIMIKIFNEVIRKLKQVRHVLNLNRDVISLCLLENIRCEIKVENRSLNMIICSSFVIKEEMKNGIYLLKGTLVISSTSMHAGVTS